MYSSNSKLTCPSIFLSCGPRKAHSPVIFIGITCITQSNNNWLNILRNVKQKESNPNNYYEITMVTGVMILMACHMPSNLSNYWLKHLSMCNIKIKDAISRDHTTNLYYLSYPSNNSIILKNHQMLVRIPICNNFFMAYHMKISFLHFIWPR